MFCEVQGWEVASKVGQVSSIYLEPAGSVFILRDVRYDILDQRRKN